MFAKVLTGSVVGLDGVLVEVEADISQGLPQLTIVGLPDKAVEESRERVKSAIRNCSADFPSRRITINLAPGDLIKEGPSFDLPIAISLLVASGQIKENLEDALFIGELSLDGKLRSTRGVLPVVILARELGKRRVFVPSENSEEARVISGIESYACDGLLDVLLHLLDEKKLYPLSHEFEQAKDGLYETDFSDISGQEYVKRAIEIAVAGGHNIHLKGPPGAGKTLIARSIPSLLPPLTFEESLEVTKIYSICGMLGSRTKLIKTRPFRSPHHSISHVGLIGGSAQVRPGEVSLAHRGVLFLDEFPEFPRGVLESLRQPLEDGIVTVSRAKRQTTFPSSFMLVASSNPCPCGYLDDPHKQCQCSSSQILRYQKRISGPLLDRIDIHVEVPAVEIDKLSKHVSSETSFDVRRRIVAARDLQHTRNTHHNALLNSELSSRHIEEVARVDKEAKETLVTAASRLHLSARSYHKIMKVARTIADLEASETVSQAHILEALQYRPQTHES